MRTARALTVFAGSQPRGTFAFPGEGSAFLGGGGLASRGQGVCLLGAGSAFLGRGGLPFGGRVCLSGGGVCLPGGICLARIADSPVSQPPPVWPCDLSHDAFDVTSHPSPLHLRVDRMTDACKNITFDRFATRAAKIYHIKYNPSGWSDPGFPRRGAPTLEFGAKIYSLTRFLPKTLWKWNPLDPPMGPANRLYIYMAHFSSNLKHITGIKINIFRFISAKITINNLILDH